MLVMLTLTNINMAILMISLGIRVTLMTLFIALVKKNLTIGGFTICSATFGNGVGIYMMRNIMVHIVFLEEEVGQKASKVVVQRVGARVYPHSKWMI